MKKTFFRQTAKRTLSRSVALLLIFTIASAYLIFNLFSLSVLKYGYYLDKTFDQITTTSLLKAKRGSIYDTNMNLLAATETTYRIFVSPRDIAKREKKDGFIYSEFIASNLSDLLSIDYDTVIKKIKNTSVLDYTLKKKASEEEYTGVRDFIKANGLDDLVFTEAQNGRYYPEGTLAAHVLGFTGSDAQGLYGLEYYYNSILSGKDGSYLYAKDAAGNPLPDEYTEFIPAIDGCSIVTTLDSFVQNRLENVLEKIRINHNVTNRVTGIVMNVETGAVLAMATSSPFDPNNPYVLDELSQYKLDNSGFDKNSEEYKKLKTELTEIMWSNKAVSETYEPGSTFKIVTVSAALDSGNAKLTDTFSCSGYHTVGGWRIKCHKVTGHGSGFSLAYGLQMSCNPTMMTLAERIGSETFYNYVKNFGYLEKTGIDLPSEAGTIFHSPENIGSTELATASFGQRFKVSIISQITAVAAVANGGKLVVPYIVEKIIAKDGSIVSQHETVVKRQVVSEEVARAVSEILEEGVSGEGGAKNAYVDGYKIAAKTGTSQKFDVLDENGNSYLRIGSTVAYAPSDSKGIAVIIVVDEPQSQVKYGSVVAAPYVSELMSDILPYLDYSSNKESTSFTVGNYVGMNIASIKKELDSLGVKYKVIGNGNVATEQAPIPYSVITKDLSTLLIYTEGYSEDEITMPNTVGMPIKEAVILLNNLGLNIKLIGVNNAYGKNINVSYQSVASGEKIRKGYTVELTVIGLDFSD